MAKRTIYMDFDSTLVNSTKRLVEMINEKRGTNVDWTIVKKYNCDDVFPGITNEEVLDFFDKREFFDGLQIFDGVKETLKNHKDNFDFHIVTIGRKPNLHNKSVWCKFYIPIPFVYWGIDKIGMGKSPEVIDMAGGIIIDDHIDNLRTSNADIKILYKGDYDTEWNTQNEGEGFIEIKNWVALNEILNNLANKKEVYND